MWSVRRNPFKPPEFFAGQFDVNCIFPVALQFFLGLAIVAENSEYIAGKKMPLHQLTKSSVKHEIPRVVELPEHPTLHCFRIRLGSTRARPVLQTPAVAKVLLDDAG